MLRKLTLLLLFLIGLQQLHLHSGGRHFGFQPLPENEHRPALLVEEEDPEEDFYRLGNFPSEDVFSELTYNLYSSLNSMHEAVQGFSVCTFCTIPIYLRTRVFRI